MLKEWWQNRKRKKVERIIEDIKSIKIQGARNIAKAALKAYFLIPTKETKNKLVHARPTEPMLVNTLHNFEHLGKDKTLKHFDDAQEKINSLVYSLIKDNYVIFTHCHATNVINSLIYAKKNGKNFEVYNTETRPLFQGRKTSLELRKSGINVTEFVDSGARIALRREQGTRKCNLVLLGADAILKNGVINKIGSGMFAEIAYDEKIPVYIIADSWKYSSHHIKLEERDFHEVWRKVHPLIKIENPAFEFIPKKYIRGIISEFGILSLDNFVKKIKN